MALIRREKCRKFGRIHTKRRGTLKNLDILILLTFALGQDYSLQFDGYGDYVSTQKLMFNGITKLIY